jgi:hypothetical protein
MIQIGALVAGKGASMIWIIFAILVILWLLGRAGERLHDWRIHSYAAGYRNRCGVDQNNSGTKTYINDLQVLICRSYIY